MSSRRYLPGWVSGRLGWPLKIVTSTLLDDCDLVGVERLGVGSAEDL
ncbi:hypothetical protein [Nocardia rhamnosiphila]|uniref:Uncharacterized protein n=1 Tax=Nocardia rhamnosiphila TaxID=426716 RepID=A0ABV2WXV5_9NOCA